MKHPILVYRDEQRRYARVARWHYIRALNLSGDKAKTHHNACEHYKLKAMAALAMMQLEISNARD